MPAPTRTKLSGPPQRPAGPRLIIMQPNPTWEDNNEMMEWLRVNIPEAKLVKTWTVTRLACEVQVAFEISRRIKGK